MTHIIPAPKLSYATSNFTAVLARDFHHLTKRFLGSLTCIKPSPSDESWVEQQLSKNEMELWSAMGRADQTHSIAVARIVEHELPKDKTAVAAALMHDIGKITTHSTLILRVLAALVQPVSRERLNRWRSKEGWLPRLAELIEYPQAGSCLLVKAGSDQFVVMWAAQHHLRPEAWTVDPVRATVLRRADNAAV
ncbi:MAG: HD domain-containing protein [Actinomycetota bacterium]|nr:HD domain-containing protein [Actinomycetota bacterium]